MYIYTHVCTCYLTTDKQRKNKMMGNSEETLNLQRQECLGILYFD